MLEVSHLTVRYGNCVIVDDVSFAVKEGQWLMLVGPNGAGKSTIVGAVSQSVPYSGKILLNGKDASRFHPAALAKIIGVLRQTHAVEYAFTVEEIVRLGRYAYSKGVFSVPDEENDRRVLQALSDTGMLPFAGQSALTLSGGELQRTFLAQVFAQDPSLLILDEPTNHLDLVYQKQIFELIASWLRQPGKAVVSVVHDLALARAYGTDAILLHRGKVAALGPVPSVLTRENLKQVYSLDVYDWMQQLLTQWK